MRTKKSQKAAVNVAVEDPPQPASPATMRAPVGPGKPQFAPVKRHPMLMAPSTNQATQVEAAVPPYQDFIQHQPSSTTVITIDDTEEYGSVMRKRILSSSPDPDQPTTSSGRTGWKRGKIIFEENLCELRDLWHDPSIERYFPNENVCTPTTPAGHPLLHDPMAGFRSCEECEKQWEVEMMYKCKSCAKLVCARCAFDSHRDHEADKVLTEVLKEVEDKATANFGAIFEGRQTNFRHLHERIFEGMKLFNETGVERISEIGQQRGWADGLKIADNVQAQLAGLEAAVEVYIPVARRLGDKLEDLRAAMTTTAKTPSNGMPKE